MVGDDGEGGDLRAGARGGRDGDEGDDVAGDFVGAFVVGDAAAVFRDDGDGFGDVHRGAAAEGDDEVGAAFLEGFGSFVDGGDGGVALGLAEGVGGDAFRGEEVGAVLDMAHFREVRAGDDEGVGAAEFLGGVTELFRRAAADEDVLGDGEAEFVHGWSSFRGLF